MAHLNKFNLGQPIFGNMMSYVGKHTEKGLSPYRSLIAHFLERLEFTRPRGEQIGDFFDNFGISTVLK